MTMKSRHAFTLMIILELAVIALGVSLYGWTVDGLQAATRFSGRISLLIFSVIFLTKNKFYLTFAVAHGIHLVELLSYVYLSGNSFNPIRAAGGMIAYAMIFAMPVAQLSYDKGKLTSKTLNVVTQVYLYYVWFIFIMTYLPRVMGKFPNAGGSQTEFMILFAWVCLMIVIRLFQRYRPIITKAPQ